MSSDNSVRRPGTETIEESGGAQAAAPPRLTVLILLSALAVLPVNMILPALPDMAVTFQADFALVNLSVAGFAVITALIEAVGGMLSDRFGRRPIVLMALSIFIAASFGCALSPNIGVFLFFRAMQACVAPCYSVALVMIKETSDDRAAASKFGYLAMGWALAPMVGPLVGGSLTELFGWRSNFVVFALLGIAAIGLAIRSLKETGARSAQFDANYLASCWQLLRSTRFWAYTLCMACSMGTVYVFFGGAPLVVGTLLGGSSAKLGLYMGLVPAGFVVGSYLAACWASKFSLGATLVFARLLTFAGLSVGLVLSLSSPGGALALFGPCLFIGIGNGLTMPVANSGALSVRPGLVGTAAGLSAAMRLAGGATIAAVAGLFLAESVPFLFVVLLISAALALLAALHAALLDRRISRPIR